MENDEKINFDKLLQESKELCNMIAQNDELGIKLNEIFKALTNAMYVQNEKINELDKTATDYKNKYEKLQERYNNLETEYKDLEKDYDLVYNANERRRELLQAIEDNEEDED